MALPCGTTGSLCSTFVPDRPVCLSVKLPYAIALYARLPSVLREPLEASVTLLEATTPVKLPTKHCPPLCGVRPQIRLASYLLRLLPILYMLDRYPILNCSKAPWGLSVLSRVTRIFTGIIISPSLSLRQCPNHYTFRAGRNLPDKEFRYLRTVIVTAAVYWGFNSNLRLR